MAAAAVGKVAVKPAREKRPRASKAPKEKKPAAPKSAPEKKPKASAKASTLSHPPYFQMIKEAILALHERTGSSSYAISKYLEEHSAVLPPNFKKTLSVQLRNSAAKGKLVKVKASFKLADGEKKVAQPAKEKKTMKEAAAGPLKRKATGAAAVTPAKKAKKAAPVKDVKSPKAKKVVVAKKAKKVASVKPKQPKSVKTPVKKAKKTVFFIV